MLNLTFEFWFFFLRITTHIGLQNSIINLNSINRNCYDTQIAKDIALDLICRPRLNFDFTNEKWNKFTSIDCVVNMVIHKYIL